MLRHGFNRLVRRSFHISRTNKNSSFQKGMKFAFGKYLLLTNTVSSGVLMFMGDIVQQEIEYQQKKLPARYDLKRFGRMFVVGLSLGPIHHYYYNYLNKILPSRSMLTISKKILLDQFIMSPICIMGFFYFMGLLEFKSITSCTEEMQNKFIEVYTMDWCLWPPTQFINFYAIPVKYQVLYINAITMLYNIFLSYIKHKESAEKYKQNALN